MYFPRTSTVETVIVLHAHPHCCERTSHAAGCHGLDIQMKLVEVKLLVSVSAALLFSC